MIDGAEMKPILRGFDNMRAARKLGALCVVSGAIEELSKLDLLPPAYLEGLRSELLNMLYGSPHQGSHTYVYLAFYGLENRSSFLKIGIAKNVRKRIQGIGTSNPMPCLWVYSAPFSSKAKAEEVEGGLLRHLATDKARGEWIHVHGLAEQACASFAASLSEVASKIRGMTVEFSEVAV